MSLPRFSLSSFPLFVIAGSLALTSTLGCSSTDDGASGAPPTLKDLVLQSTTVDVGKQSTIAGTVTIEDADGDIDSLLAEITPPGGAAQSLPPSKVANAAGVTSAPVQLGVVLVLPAAGDYKLAVWAKDTAGHESAKIVQTLTAK